jgi:hypothetical protein
MHRKLSKSVSVSEPYLICVAIKHVQGLVRVTCVPQTDHIVSTAGDEQMLLKRTEGEAHDFEALVARKCL